MYYLDLPIQHASDPVLKRMGRRTTKAELVEIIEKLRSEIPDIILRTTLITGFPGETEEDHQELMDFVDQMEFDRLGVFTYSQEEDTPAASMEGQIPEELKEERKDQLMELQQEISLEKGRPEGRTGSICDDRRSDFRRKCLYWQDLWRCTKGRWLYFCTDRRTSGNRRFCECTDHRCIGI